MEKPETPTDPKHPDPASIKPHNKLNKDLNKDEQKSDLKDGKIRINLVYDMKTGVLSMGSGAPEIMVLGVLTQAITMVGQKQILKTLSMQKPLHPKKSILLKQ